MLVTRRTAALLAQTPKWFAAQALDAAKNEQKRREAADRHRGLEFLCSVEVRESDFGEWLDTVAAFNRQGNGGRSTTFSACKQF